MAYKKGAVALAGFNQLMSAPFVYHTIEKL